ncbi:MAG: helix-turn-helix transcriptional regulator [Sphingopyxis sp.]|nr:helix-turn-helix transcriptional regulator [Sphingopyxis sp.]
MTMFPVESIYDAAADEQLFPDLLRRIADHFGAQAGFIAWMGSGCGAGFQAEYGNDPAYLKSYVETYAPLDILRPALMETPEGEPRPVYPLLQAPDVRDSRFYREYLAPQRIVDNLAVNLIKRDDMFATIAILRTGDVAPFPDEDIDRMRTLVPHLRRAVILSSHRIRQADLVSAYREAAQGARDGLVLLGDDGQILDLGPDIERITGFASIETASRSSFARALARSAETDTPMLREFTFDGRKVRLLLASRALSRNPYGDLSEGRGAAHAVSVTEVDRRWGLAYGAMVEAHALTAGEARVLEDVLTHGEMIETPARLGVARATVRSHLHKIYAKTDTSGFPDLCLYAHRFIVAAR